MRVEWPAQSTEVNGPIGDNKDDGDDEDDDADSVLRDSRFTVAVHTPLQASATPHENGGSHPTHPESCRHPDIFSS